MKEIKCIFGFHKYVLHAANHKYNTTTIYNDNDTKYFWWMGFFQCKRCEKRIFKTNNSCIQHHSGMVAAKEAWNSIGHIPANSEIFTNV